MDDGPFNRREEGTVPIKKTSKFNDKAGGGGLGQGATSRIKYAHEDDDKVTKETPNPAIQRAGEGMISKSGQGDDAIGEEYKDDTEDDDMLPGFAGDQADINARCDQRQGNDNVVELFKEADADPAVDNTDASSNKLSTNHIDQDPPTDGHVTQFQKRRRSTIFADFTVPEVIYKFTSPRWLVSTGMFAFIFSGFGFYTSFCQLLDPASIDPEMFYADMEGARRLMENPNYTTPCIDSFQSACGEQYAYSVFFFIYGLYLAYMGLVRMSANCGFFKPISTNWTYRLSYRQRHNSGSVAVHPQPVHQPGDVRSLSSIASKASLIYSIFKESRIYDQIRKLNLGGDFFWMKSFVVLAIDIVLQLMRCFAVVGSYATTNATHTLAQLVLIILNINICMVAFYFESEIGFTSVHWFFEMSYLILRLSVAGHLSMRASGWVDFLTIAVPLIFVIEEIKKVTTYILSARRHAADEGQGLSVLQRYSSMIVSFVMLCTTIVGAFAIYIVVDTGFVRYECNDVLPINLSTDSGLCEQWQYNLFLQPACSCVYFRVVVNPGSQCGIFGEDPKYAFEPFAEHFEDLAFFDISLHQQCPLLDQDFDLITSFTGLKHLDISGLDVQNLGPQFKRLPNLVSVDISHSSLQQIDLDVLHAWPLLESFSCNPCPSFESQDLFVRVHLPRLKNLKVYGSSSCPDKSKFEHFESYRCVDRNATRDCPSMPQWFVQHYVDHAQGATRTECFQPRCPELLTYFNKFDLDGNGLVTHQVIRTDLGGASGPLLPLYTSYSNEAIHCLMKEIREAVPFKQDFYEDAVIEDGITPLEYSAFWTAYGNCAECEFAQEIISRGAEVFSSQDAVTEAPLPPACVSLWDGPTPFDIREVVNAACYTETSACIPTVCGTHLDDSLSTEEDFRSFATAVGFGYLAPRGIYDCFEAVTEPGCFSRTSAGHLALEGGLLTGMTMAVAFGFEGLGSTCADCVFDADPDCRDNDEFVDAFGYSCRDWTDYYCYDAEATAAMTTCIPKMTNSYISAQD